MEFKTSGIVNAINKLAEKQAIFQPIALNFTGGITPKGAYNAGTAYATGDSVYYTDGSSYVAIQATTGNLPTNTTYWQILASKGDTGAVGGTGATGTSTAWYKDAGAPDAGLGSDNDFYLNITNYDIYEKLTGAWTLIGNFKGADGSIGTDGVNAEMLTSGAGAPDAGLGVDGDFYINETNGDLYKKATGAWSVISNIIGPAGNNGADGVVQAIVAGTNITVDDTDPANPIISSGGGSGGGGEGILVNGKIEVSVTSGNLTVALKTLADADPSAGDPVQIQIKGVIHTITSALSLVRNAGTNYLNFGGAEFATMEVDLFAYLWYVEAVDEIRLVAGKRPHFNSINDVSITQTNEDAILANSTADYTATDPLVNIGRFAAALSEGAGYTWTVPTFTEDNLRQEKTLETRLLLWNPQFSASGSMTITSITSVLGQYRIINRKCEYFIKIAATLAGTANNFILNTLPIKWLGDESYKFMGVVRLFQNAAWSASFQAGNGTTRTSLVTFKVDTTNFTLGTFQINSKVDYDI